MLISDVEANYAASQNASGEAETRLITPASSNKLTGQDLDPNKLTKRETIMVLAVYYENQYSEKDNKSSLVKLPKEEIDMNVYALHMN